MHHFQLSMNRQLHQQCLYHRDVIYAPTLVVYRFDVQDHLGHRKMVYLQKMVFELSIYKKKKMNFWAKKKKKLKLTPLSKFHLYAHCVSDRPTKSKTFDRRKRYVGLKFSKNVICPKHSCFVHIDDSILMIPVTNVSFIVVDHVARWKDSN